ncbi:MAG: hypothetical protein V4608_14535 [Bacteroidota bacterium]
MKPLIVYALLCCSLIFLKTAHSQEVVKDDTKKDKDWGVEIEPSNFALRGYSVQINRNITKNNCLNIGLYTAALDVPLWAKKGMFLNLPDDADVRLGFQAALVVRYKFKIGQKESCPYVGLIGGWEYFDISHPSLPDMRITTIIATPYIGYEIYYFKQLLYINPQLRGVFYVDPQNNRPGRMETMKSAFLLPAVSLGIKF